MGRSAAKSSQAARNSRLSSARASESRRCQAGSILRKVNFAKVRSAAATLAMLVPAYALLGTFAPAAQARTPRVVVAVLPTGTTPTDLGRVPGMALGLMSAGIGKVPEDQTYLDISQGTRLNPTLYNGPLPPLYLALARAELAVPNTRWGQVRARADSAPADVVPGLLASTLAGAGTGVWATAGAGTAALIDVDEGGAVPLVLHRCARLGCPGLTVTL